MLYAIDPHQHEQGHDGAPVRALEKLAYHHRAIIIRAWEVISTLEAENAAEQELLDALKDDMKMAAGIKPLVPGSLI